MQASRHSERQEMGERAAARVHVMQQQCNDPPAQEHCMRRIACARQVSSGRSRGIPAGAAMFWLWDGAPALRGRGACASALSSGDSRSMAPLRSHSNSSTTLSPAHPRLSFT